MNISKISGIKTGLGIALVAGTISLAATAQKSKTNTPTETKDKFEYVNKQDTVVTNEPTFKTKLERWAIRTFSDEVILPPAKGSAVDSVLAFAPDPWVVVQGQQKALTFVVDVTNNILYHYDKDGNPIMGYRIASGKLTPQMQTDEGLKIVSHIETYPYKTAPAHTKRRKNPRDYGPRCIILDKLDPNTGKRSSTGEFIHGNKDASSIGKHASQGCMRMDNEVIKELAKAVKRGDLVMIIRRIR